MTTTASVTPSGEATTRSRRWVAWLFLLPTFVLFLVFMVYPTIYTILLSFDRGRRGDFTQFLGLDNYVTLLTKDPAFLNLRTFPPSGAVVNNLMWAVLYVSFVIAIGLFIAVAATRVRYESIIKAVVFVPMAIGATAMALIWNFVFAPSPSTGVLNAILDGFGRPPVSWLGDPGIVNLSLITVGVWGSVGFATVILSAAIKSIPSEIMEAARTDGATERQIFFRIIVPMVSLPISVLAVTLVVNVVKLFDLVYVMTRGGPGTSSRVIAFSMYQEAFPGGLYGKGAAVAVIMLVLLVPIMGFNIRRFRAEFGPVTESMTQAPPPTRTEGVSTRLAQFFSRSPIHVVLGIIGLIWLVPTIGLLITSFRPRSDIQASGWWETLFSLRFTLDNYAQVITGQGSMGQAFVNSLLIAVPSTLLPMAIGALAAYALTWTALPHKDLMFVLVVAFMLVPVQVAFIPVLKLFAPTGLLSGFVPIWLAHTAFALPFGIFLMRNFFILLPRDLIEASRMDGAGDWTIFRRVVVPLSVPAIAAYGIFQFLWVWNDLLMSLIFVQKAANNPMPVQLSTLLGQYGSEWNLLAAGAFLLMAVPLIVFFALQRYFVQGLLAGSVK